MTTIDIPEATRAGFIKLPTPVLVVGVIGAALYGLYLWLLPKPLPGIPYDEVSAKRILGDIPSMDKFGRSGDTPRRFFTRAAGELSAPLIQIFLGPFNKPALVISDFREAQDLQVRHAKVLNRGKMNREIWNGLIPGHFIAMEDDDERYKGARELARDLMTPSFINQVNAPASHERVEECIALWRHKISVAKGRPFDVIRDLGLLTFDIMLTAALGFGARDSEVALLLRRLQTNPEEQGGDCPQSLGGPDTLYQFPYNEEPEIMRAIDRITLAAAHAANSPSAWTFHAFNKLTPSMRKAQSIKTRTAQSYIDRSTRRLAEEGSSFKPQAAVDYMVSREAALAAKAGRKPDFSSASIHDGLFAYIVGGQDSTHSTLSFLVKHLGEHQQIQTRLRDALFQGHSSARASNAAPTIEEILKVKVPYLDAFIEEVLRLSNPSMVISKETATDLTILGHHVPKGTVILFSSMGPTITCGGAKVDESLRSETSQKARGEIPGDWNDGEYPGEEFHPERWLKADKDVDAGGVAFDPKAGPILTFSAGPRMCWGRRLAYMELKLIVTLFVWNFTFAELPAGLHDWDVVDNMFIRPKHANVKLGIVPPAGKVQ